MAIGKFSPQFRCPKCGNDKSSTRFEEAATLGQEIARRKRLGWPEGELIVSSCQLCTYTTISLPLDAPDSNPGGNIERCPSCGRVDTDPDTRYCNSPWHSDAHLRKK